MPKLPLYDDHKRRVGEGRDLENLWHARAGSGNAIRSRGNYWPAKSLNIMAQVDVDRHARHAVIAFPDTGAAYVVQNQLQLKAIIHKLIGIYQHIDARGQSAVISFGRDDTS